MNGIDGMMGGWGPVWMVLWLLILLLLLALVVYGLVRLFQDLSARRGGPDGPGKR